MIDHIGLVVGLSKPNCSRLVSRVGIIVDADRQQAEAHGKPEEIANAEVLDAAMALLEIADVSPQETVRQLQARMSQLILELGSIRQALGPKAWTAFVETAMCHPISRLVGQDPITNRSAKRPRGYAGDAALLDLIYFGCGLPLEDNPHAHGISHFVFHSASCTGVRERRDILAKLVDDAAATVERPAVFAIAAGHLREADISAAFQRGDVGRWIALDQDEESLRHIAARYHDRVELVSKPVAAILRGDYDPGELDLAYAAGLYDYLPTAIAKKLTRKICRMLRPGGKYLFANFAIDVVDAGYMEAMMDWHLILRSLDDMEEIAIFAGENFVHRIWTGVGGAIHYCEIERVQG